MLAQSDGRKHWQWKWLIHIASFYVYVGRKKNLTCSCANMVQDHANNAIRLLHDLLAWICCVIKVTGEGIYLPLRERYTKLSGWRLPLLFLFYISPLLWGFCRVRFSFIVACCQGPLSVLFDSKGFWRAWYFRWSDRTNHVYRHVNKIHPHSNQQRQSSWPIQCLPSSTR